MKNILNIVLIILCINCKAQTIVNINTYNIGDNSNKYFKDLDNNYQNFIGTWENTTNNITFRLILWKEQMKPLLVDKNSFMDDIYGKFLIIQNAHTANEIILHNSIKYFPQSNTTTDWCLLGKGVNATICGGSIDDTCANNGSGVLSGSFALKILNLGSNQLQAHWKVFKNRFIFSNENFTIPMDCILTKH